jgi:hypothetical protein
MATKKKTSKAKSKKVLKKKPAAKKKAAAKNAPAKKAAPAKKKKLALKKRPPRGKSQTTSPVVFSRAGRGADSGGQSGALQGLSNRAGADSESVDELLEEGNAFEAEIVDGVENAPDADEGEVHTHEVPEDDVPEEYLDQDK